MNKIFKNLNFYIIACFILISIINAAIFIPILSRPTVESDSIYYDTIALNLSEKYEYTKFKKQDFLISPGYPFFLSLIYKIFGQNHILVYYIQFLLLAGISSIAYLICKKYYKFKNWQAIIPGLIIIFWPYYILHSSFLYTEIFYSFLLAIFAYFLFNYIDKPNYKKSVLLGVIISIITLTRPVFILLPFWLLGFSFLFYLLKRKKQNIINKKNLKFYIISIFIFITVLLSWGGFSYKKTGYFNPFVTSSVNLVFNLVIRHTDNVVPQISYSEDNSPKLKQTIKTKFKNTYRFWKSGAAGTQAAELIEKHPIAKYLIFFYRIIFYAILGLAFSSLYYLNKNKYILIIWLIIFYFWAVHSVLFPLPRYTLPIIQLIIILAVFSFFEYKKQNAPWRVPTAE
ncbi:glycosyltransferase family 39 protein [Candidatus Parcubacteria bacterium]|nr:glycosyltransferase family 39 protein [Candidatus Parcubacteria bacterium]